MERPALTKPAWYRYLNEQGNLIKENPLLGRNDFIRPFQGHQQHLERLPQKELFKSLWVTIQFSVNPVTRFIPFRDILRKNFN